MISCDMFTWEEYKAWRLIPILSAMSCGRERFRVSYILGL